MSVEEFKRKFSQFLIEVTDSPFTEEEVDDGIIADMFYEFMSTNDLLTSQIYVSLNMKYLNVTIEPGDFEDNGGILLGFNKINHLPFCGILVGSDWEIPVFMIVFFDKNDELALYIPEKGNLFNKFSLEAYPNDGDALHESHMKYDWGDIQNDIHNKIIYDGKNYYLDYKPLKKKDKGLPSMTITELNKLLQESLEVEDYMKAAEIKKELDSRDI